MKLDVFTHVQPRRFLDRLLDASPALADEIGLVYGVAGTIGQAAMWGPIPLGLLVAVIGVGALLLAVRLLTGRSAELPYFAGLFIALVVRLPVESVMLAQFNIITVMFFMTLTATVYGQDAAPVRLAGGVRRSLRRQKLDRGLVQQREVRRSRKPKMLRHTKVVKPAVHGPRRRRGKRVLRQTRRPLDAGSKPSDDGAST